MSQYTKRVYLSCGSVSAEIVLEKSLKIRAMLGSPERMADQCIEIKRFNTKRFYENEMSNDQLTKAFRKARTWINERVSILDKNTVSEHPKG